MTSATQGPTQEVATTVSVSPTGALLGAATLKPHLLECDEASFFDEVRSVCADQVDEVKSACLAGFSPQAPRATMTTTTTTTKTVTISTTCSPTATPALQNGDFESPNSLEPWYIVKVPKNTIQGGHAVVLDEAAANQNHVFKATLPPPGTRDLKNVLPPHGKRRGFSAVMFDQKLSTCTDAVYNLSFRYKIEAPAGTTEAIYIIVSITNGEEVINLSGRNMPSVWTLATGSFRALSDLTYVKVSLLRGLSSGMDEKVIYLDDFNIVAV
ncbi:hypothetical protein TWF481_002338 [Arthrobotrys musiformis]|uniref:Uncharacterized protein n=1 Tax=Arthrobotrys musiformis TaxID=47236 RepID=A0AAV9VSZ1_9PEZI